MGVVIQSRTCTTPRYFLTESLQYKRLAAPIFGEPHITGHPGCACDMICTRHVSNLMKVWRGCKGTPPPETSMEDGPP